jgi:nickel/cobalt transporter (NiCoT) family protein
MSALARLGRSFDRDERRRLCGFAAAIGALHLVGWGLVALYAPGHPVLGGLAVLAYSFGLRHAFDADHISAIDNVTRKLLAEGGRPLGVGFFFSLGHATVVFGLSLALAVAAVAVHHGMPALALYGGAIGTGISGAFLCAIGLLNLTILVGIVRIARDAKRGRLNEARLDARLQQRGVMSRLFGRRLRLIRGSWQMYPVGVLFGLGFDTATEVGLLTLTAGVATGNVPALAICALPVLFAAGMAAMDTVDGVFMTTAYGWALSTPARKIFYNVTVTGLSVVVALGIGSVELLQLFSHELGWGGRFWSWLQGLNFSTMGFAVVGLFVVTWVVALAVWRWRGIERRRQSPRPARARSGATRERPGSLLPRGLVELHLAQPDHLRRDLDALVLAQELERLVERQLPLGHEAHQLICGR